MGHQRRLFSCLLLITASLIFTFPHHAHAYGSRAAAEQTQTQTTHPAIQQANDARDHELRRKRMLLLFPAGVIGIIVILLIKTRHKRPQQPSKTKKREE